MGTRLIKEKGFLNTNGIISIQKELEENNADETSIKKQVLIYKIERIHTGIRRSKEFYKR